MKPMRIAARPWKRILAYGFDLLILNFILLGPFSGWIESSLPKGMDSINAGKTISGPAYAIILIIFMLALMYFTLLDYLAGQSIGMMVFNLFTVLPDKKATPGFMRCLLRNAAILPIFPLIFLWVADPIYMAFKKVRLSDLVTQSFVIEKVEYTQYRGW